MQIKTNDVINLVAQRWSLKPDAAADVVQAASQDARAMTKREVFAAHAMVGLTQHVRKSNEGSEWVAEEAVKMADALIAELAKEKTT